MTKIFTAKRMLILFIILCSGYLTSKFPDESILIGGISIIIVIAIWLLQIEKENE